MELTKLHIDLLKHIDDTTQRYGTFKYLKALVESEFEGQATGKEITKAINELIEEGHLAKVVRKNKIGERYVTLIYFFIIEK